MAVLIVGHRGDPRHAPENTLASLESAYRHGRRAMEMDIQITRDGVPIVFHDGRLGRTVEGKGLVRKIDWKRLRKLPAAEPVPSLAKALDAFKHRNVTFFLDVKAAGAAPAIHRVVVRRQLQNRCHLAGYRLRDLKAMTALRPRMAVYQVTGFKQPVTERMVRRAQALGLSGFLVYKRWVHSRLVRRLKEADLKLYVWTIRRLSEEMRMRRLGVTGIMSERCLKLI